MDGGNEAVIQFRDDEGNFRTREVRNVNDAFNFPEMYPEADQPGARIVTATTVYCRGANGKLWHHDNHPTPEIYR